MSSKFETSSIPFHNLKRRAKNPSFSSILLDTIYRSIDDDNHHHHHDHSHSHSHGYYPRTTPTSPTHNNIVKHRDYDDIDIHASDLVLQRRTKMRSDSTLETLDLRRAIMIESWIEKHPPQQKSQQKQQKMHFDIGDNLNDQTVRIIRQKSVPSRAAPAHDDILSSTSSCFTNFAQRSSSREQSSSRIFTKTKSRAMKMYCDLKKSKSQTTPISPGRRIAAFLNSIFRNPSNSSTPAKTSPENPPRPLSTTSNSTCSTGSSFSRSCLSNKTSFSSKSTPTTTTTTTTKTKRSVRFYPVSVILDEDSRPCGHKALHNNDENEGFKKLVSPGPVNGRGEVEQSKWRREKEIDALMKMINANCVENNKKVARYHSSSFEGDAMDEDEEEEVEEEEDDDDNGSCGSSDLFELENLSSIGIGGVSRYYEELPVYGTTSLKNITV